MPHLWVVDVDSKTATSITSGDDFGIRSLTWSADSSMIAAGINTWIGATGPPGSETTRRAAARPVTSQTAAEGRRSRQHA